MSVADPPSEMVFVKTMAQTSSAEESWEKGEFDRMTLEAKNPRHH